MLRNLGRIGVLLALAFGWAVAFDWGRRAEADPMHVWTYGGPLAVAIWNLWRMHSKPKEVEEAR